jgi:hypothetical protein
MKIQKIAIAALLAATASYGAAATITFDDLSTYPPQGFIQIPENYAGFTWVDFFVQNRETLPGSGYENGNVSPPNSAFNSFAGSASFASETPFRLESLYLAKAYYNGLTRFEGYSGPTLIYSADIYATTTAATLVTFNWSHLTKVVVSDADNSLHSVIDNITVAVIPEPETYTMLIGGLGLLGLLARRRGGERLRPHCA